MFFFPALRGWRLWADGRVASSVDAVPVQSRWIPGASWLKAVSALASDKPRSAGWAASIRSKGVIKSESHRVYSAYILTTEDELRIWCSYI
jgi:hypothetical protein